MVAVEDPTFWRDTRSHVFHGRDIMAPVAAHVVRGTPLQRLGPAVDPSTLVPLAIPPPAKLNEHGEIVASVLYIDTFGNIITNITENDLAALGTMLHDPLTSQVNLANATDLVAPHELCYAAVPPGEFACLMNSENRFEIAVNTGSAGARFPGIATGTGLVVGRRAR